MYSSKNQMDDEANHEKRILALERQVALGLWIQSLGQLIEINGLSGLLQMEEDMDSSGEKTILAGNWVKFTGILTEALSVSKQIGETDKSKLIKEQEAAITGDLLAALGSLIEVFGGVEVLQEEKENITFLVP
ncbi:hypothetical protein [Falsibacillus albus]|uniref:Uncharacterized protein n=1 Tax=Falsibacillus albus TaxID=2478915 RepID=A0A3L7K0U9_9BACI|nr:hypothetical protein [Falsibacillus albus]RLQ94272.1 hypothetical protein D9X91_14520 [Falsibacillus albus]